MTSPFARAGEADGARSADSNPWIECAISQIGDKVCKYNREGNCHEQCQEKRSVARLDGSQHQPSHARPSEYDFNDDCAGYQLSCPRADNRDDWKHRPWHRVKKENTSFGQPFGPCGSNMVTCQLIDKTCTGKTNERCHLLRRKYQGRQGQMPRDIRRAP